MLLFEFGIENVGHPVLPQLATPALFAASGLLLAYYARYALRRTNAAIDVTQLRVRTFRVCVTFGGLGRIGISSITFLLPLFFQLGFGLTPLQSGLLTFTANFGTVFTRVVNAKLLRAFGFKVLLSVNTIVAALGVAGFALFDANSSHTLLILYIICFGMLRNVQFTSQQALTFADIGGERLSKATSLAGVVQQLSQGFGVSISATLLGLIAGSTSVVSVGDFHRVFLAIAHITLLSLPGFLQLAPNDGAQVSHHRRR
jgi:hypothetical protein